MKRFFMTLGLVTICALKVRAATGGNEYAAACEMCRTHTLPPCHTTDASHYTTVNCEQYSDQTCTIGTIVDFATGDNDTEHMCSFAVAVSVQDEIGASPAPASGMEAPTTAATLTHTALEELAPSVAAAAETLATEDAVPPKPPGPVASAQQPMDSMESYQSDAASTDSDTDAPQSAEMPVADVHSDAGDVGVVDAPTTAKTLHELVAQNAQALPPVLTSPQPATSTTAQAPLAMTCYGCSSNDDSSCAKQPTKQKSCAPSENQTSGCFTLVRANVTTRGCISDLTEESESYCASNQQLCSLCYVASCNHDKTAGNGASNARAQSAGSHFMLAALAGIWLRLLLAAA